VAIAGKRSFAVLHAGWRGTAAGILPHAVRRLELEHGERPERLSVFFGPAIDGCHYEVGEEVIRALAVSGSLAPDWIEGRRVDLRRFLVRQGADCGIPSAAMHTVGPCTFCEKSLASYRRDGAEACRQISLAYFEPANAGP
jgi:copper oxidase (laccase) domain-containing protein